MHHAFFADYTFATRGGGQRGNVAAERSVTNCMWGALHRSVCIHTALTDAGPVAVKQAKLLRRKFAEVVPQ